MRLSIPTLLCTLATITALSLQPSTALAQGTAFTYQGRLNDAANPANGNYDLRFVLYDAVSGGAQQGNPLTNSATAISNGLFTVTLDFGTGVFTGADRWLEISVRSNLTGAFTALSPRQLLTPTPYAVTASNLSGMLPASQVSGAISLAQLPTNVVTNGASGVYFSGTFSGNGAGITGVDLRAANSQGAISFSTNYGMFVESSSPSVGSNPISVTPADVNGDGKLDLISANNNLSGTLTVLTNNGSGGFVSSATLSVGNHPTWVVAADVNGDTKVDLITANYNPGGTLTVLTNNGSGGFAFSSSPGVGNNPYSVRPADVNGDGKVDLITANYNLSGTLTVLTNNGSGGFAISSSPAVGTYPDSVAAADVNGDGKADLICANNDSPGTLTVLTNNGSGSFTISSSPTVGSYPTSITATDVNGDGKPDLISANSDDNTLTVLTNNGSGDFVLSSSPGVAEPISVTAADVNGDGQVDLIAANYGADTLSVVTNNGAGGFVLASSPGVGNNPAWVAAADVNGDGRVDLITANYNLSGTLTVLFNTTTFTPTFTGNLLASSPYLKVIESQPKGTSAGANVAGENNSRHFSTILANTLAGSSLSAGDVILPAGTYQCRISAPGYRVNAHQTRLRTSTGTVLLYGTSEFSDNNLSPGVQTRSLIEGTFTLAATSTVQVQHFMNAIQNVNGLGLAANATWTDGDAVEIYAVAEFWEIK